MKITNTVRSNQITASTMDRSLTYSDIVLKLSLLIKVKWQRIGIGVLMALNNYWYFSALSATASIMLWDQASKTSARAYAE
ncbi:hypothetical protein VIGAN_02068400 [Vigna angularis var. angularis]|uniref:Uncharacterized protein n=1 Tax=Vigna angularis var. angularis TaxID=157739 RepID=A0A0S3RBQ4_PHAAN|nr:hypothetical protein VIGAN_02068400 [Vigna angularis var. angularis]